MTRENIHERREYIKRLLDEGQEIDIRDTARMWDSSYPAIVADIAVCKGLQDPYYKQKTQTFIQNRRAAKLKINGELTEHDWSEILNKFSHKCANCGIRGDLTIDHIIPLSRGGENAKENIQPLCRYCNSSKGARTMKDWAAAVRENGKKGGRPRKTT